MELNLNIIGILDGVLHDPSHHIECAFFQDKLALHHNDVYWFPLFFQFRIGDCGTSMAFSAVAYL